MIWNAGERTLQEEAGTRAKLEAFGPRIMRSTLPAQHRELLAKLPFLLLGGVREGRPASLVAWGDPGWIATPDERTVRIDLRRHAGDLDGLAVGDAVGLLAIELATRRRNRLGARVVARRGDVVELAVDVSFGNCPQYIQAREVAPGPPRARTMSTGFGPAARALVAGADTFFLVTSARPDPAAGDASEGVDVSHRGGRPGFVRVEGSTLTWPDFPGNNFFNSLGNLLLHPRAALLFVDFERGDVLALEGRAEVLRGHERTVRVELESARFEEGALPLRFSPPELAEELV